MDNDSQPKMPDFMFIIFLAIFVFACLFAAFSLFNAPRTLLKPVSVPKEVVREELTECSPSLYSRNIDYQNTSLGHEIINDTFFVFVPKYAEITGLLCDLQDNGKWVRKAFEKNSVAITDNYFKGSPYNVKLVFLEGTIKKNWRCKKNTTGEYEVIDEIPIEPASGINYFMCEGKLFSLTKTTECKVNSRCEVFYDLRREVVE
jgi:hypothetical protein